MKQTTINTTTINTLLNAGLFILIILVAYLIFTRYLDENTPRPSSSLEGFASKDKFDDATSQYTYKTTATIYEKSLELFYGNSQRLMCNMLPNLTDESCLVDGVPIKKDKFPVHLFKDPDSIILGVFNDGAIYKKTSMRTGIWSGPIDGSMPNGGRTPLRMITISANGNEFLGVGFDNKLYIKNPNSANELDINSPWQLVNNNKDLIYVITDPNTQKLIGINKDGSLMIKQSQDITSDFILLPSIGVNALKLYFDNNGYMLVLDDNFNIWQMMDKDWQNSQINMSKGSNPTRVNDILYDNDGKFYGLVFPLNAEKLTLMKQGTHYFLSVFLPILSDMAVTSDKVNYMISDNSIILSKSGVDYKNTEYVNDDPLDDDIQHAVVRNDLDNKRKLRQLCSVKKMDYDPSKMENYELLEDIDNNDKKIADLKAVLDKLKSY